MAGLPLFPLSYFFVYSACSVRNKYFFVFLPAFVASWFKHLSAAKTNTPLSSHAAALFGTLAAGAGTLAAVFVLVLLALVRALLAGLCAKTAELFGAAAAQAHQLRRSITDSGTLHVELYTARHHVGVFFLQARRSTVVANGGTAQTGFYAAPVFVVSSGHNKGFR